MKSNQKPWLDAKQQSFHFFNHPEDTTIHNALSSVLYHIVNSENHHERSREYQYFSRILKEEFDLNESQISRLHNNAETALFNLNEDLETINHYLKENPQIRMQFMDRLIHFIDVDGVHENQLMTFNRALHVIFPYVQSV